MSNAKKSMLDDILNRDNMTDLDREIIEINYDLTIDNYDTFDERLNRRALGQRCVQENRWHGMSRSFQMYKDSHLFQELHWYRAREKKTYRLNLACLQRKPEHIVTLEWKWVSTAIATAIWSAVLVYLGSFTAFFNSNSIQPEHAIAAGILMATITFISLILFIYQKKDQYIFYTYCAQVPIVILDTNKPDPITFEATKDRIIRGINRSTVYKDPQEVLVTELKELRRLRDEGIILDKDYEAARQQIFSHQEYSSSVDTI